MSKGENPRLSQGVMPACFHYILGKEIQQALEREGIVCGVRQKVGTQRLKFAYHAAPVTSAKHNCFGLISPVFKL